MILLAPTLHNNIINNVSSANNCLDYPNMGDISKMRPCLTCTFLGGFPTISLQDKGIFLEPSSTLIKIKAKGGRNQG